MTYFAINLILAFVWAGLIGSFSLSALITGYALGYAILYAFSSGDDAKEYLRKIPLLCGFIIYYLVELVRANLQIAVDLLRLRPRFNPGFLKYPLTLRDDTAITLLANLVTMTPGTLAVDVSQDRQFLLVHGLYMHDPEAVKADIRKNLERRIIDLFKSRSHVR